MKSTPDPLDTPTTRLLLNKLPDILTATEEDVKSAIESSPEEAGSLADALEQVAQSGRNAREWLGGTMSALPIGNWVEHDGAFQVTASNGASLKFLLQHEMVEGDATEDAQVQNRSLLLDELFKLLADAPARYAPMMTRVQLYPDYPIQQDIALARTIDLVEAFFMQVYGRLERKKQHELGVSISGGTPLPIEHIRPLGMEAFVTTYEHLDQLSAGPDHEVLQVNLVVSVMSNIAANRVLLESAQLAALAKEAAAVNKDLLTALNQAGIAEVSNVQDDEGIRAMLVKLFGSKGMFKGTDGMSRSLGGSDLEATLAAAKFAQGQYLKTRASVVRQESPAAHTTASETLMFALAMAGLFQKRKTVLSEFTSWREYAAFPARGAARTRPLRPHALELVKTMYSQMAYANNGWSLLAHRIEDYERAMAFKRACFQMLIFRIFKRWTAGKLCKLYVALSPEPR